MTSPSDGRYRHELAPGFGHALLTPIVCRVFAALRVGASVWDGSFWWALHSEPSVAGFEFEHGLTNERYAYNARSLERVLADKRGFTGEHAGYRDAFVPVCAGGQVVAVLVVGPFSTVPPAASRVLELWRGLARRQADPADPEFAAYLDLTFRTLVLPGAQAKLFEQLLECLAELMTARKDAAELVNRADSLRAELEAVRFAEHSWDVARTMIDDRTTRTWSSVSHAFVLKTLGLSRAADHVLVGLASDSTPGAGAVDAAVRHHALQRRCCELARRHGAVAGQAGEHGVVFLTAIGDGRRANEKATALAERVARVAQSEFSLRVHFGASAAVGSAPLSRSYQAALGAAESALAQGLRLAFAKPATRGASHSLRQLRLELAQLVRERPSALGARFETYLEAVARRAGYRMDQARGELDMGFVTITEPLVETGALDPRSLDALAETLDRDALAATTLSELSAGYRRAVAQVVAAVEKPVVARHDGSLRRAIDYIKQHYVEPLQLKQAARAAGFTPNYFSELFKKQQGIAFTDYVNNLRIERARQLLSTTRLPVARVGELCGLVSPQYFARVFRQHVGTTAREYREKTPGFTKLSRRKSKSKLKKR